MTKFVRQLTDFHTIKTKLISQQRTTAQDYSVVEEWFQDYSQFLYEHAIEPEDL